MDAEDRTGKLVSVPSAQAGLVVPENAMTEDHVAEQVYFVKLHAYENPNFIKVENLIRKLDQDRILTNQMRDQEKLHNIVSSLLIMCFQFHKQGYRDKLYHSLHCMQYYNNWRWRWKRSDLELLRLSLDKLCFANNRTRGKAINTNSAVKEIDCHGLHFGLLHASKSMAEERRILSKIKEVGKIPKQSCITMEDYNEKISILHGTMRWNYMNTDEERQINQEIEKLDQAKVEAIFNVVLNGKMWNSLGSKENIKQEIGSLVAGLEERRAAHLKYNAEVIFHKKELETVEDDLTSLEKQLEDIGRLKCEARECISLWRTEQEEKNANYDKYIELMRNAQELVEKKDVEGLRKLSHEEVEKFMFHWSNDKAFRDDYRTRSIATLNKQCLTIDGRRRNGDEEPVFVKEHIVNVSKAMKKALQMN